MRHVVGPRHGVIKKRPGHELAAVAVIDRLFWDGLPSPWPTPPITWPSANSGLIIVPKSSTIQSL